jgi:transcriptional regulator with XRE-family HTH domain
MIPNIENIALSQKIKMLRKTLKLTQKEFASAICEGNNGVKRIVHIENDSIKKLLPAEIAKLENIYNVNKYWLLHGDGEAFSDGTKLEVLKKENNKEAEKSVSLPAASADAVGALRSEIAYLKKQIELQAEIIALLKNQK